MRSMQWQLAVLGTISAFAYRHRETKKNPCRDGRSQDLPNTGLSTPKVWQLNVKRRRIKPEAQGKRLTLQTRNSGSLLVHSQIILVHFRRFRVYRQLSIPGC